MRYTHTFATFVHASGDGDDLSAWMIQEVVDISWLPQTMVLHPLRFRAEETGINLELPATLRWAKCNGLGVSMWGPYEIRPALFEMACTRANYLQSGAVGYNVVDRRRRPLVLDCIHAVSGIDRSRGSFHTRLAFGDIASYFVLHHFRDSLINPCVPHDWVAERLGAFASPIRRRDYCEIPFSLLPFFSPSYSQER